MRQYKGYKRSRYYRRLRAAASVSMCALNVLIGAGEGNRVGEEVGKGGHEWKRFI